MKKMFLLMTVLMSLTTLSIQAQSEKIETKAHELTSIGIVIYSNDAETIYNAMRFANYSKNQGDTVSIFLLGKGVDLDKLVKNKKNLKEQTEAFLESGGEIMGCGSCLKSRKNKDPQICTFSSMSDLYNLVRKNQIIMTF